MGVWRAVGNPAVGLMVGHERRCVIILSVWELLFVSEQGACELIVGGWGPLRSLRPHRPARVNMSVEPQSAVVAQVIYGCACVVVAVGVAGGRKGELVARVRR